MTTWIEDTNSPRQSSLQPFLCPPAPPRVPPPRPVVFDPLRFKRVWGTSNSTIVLIGHHPTSFFDPLYPNSTHFISSLKIRRSGLFELGPFFLLFPVSILSESDISNMDWFHISFDFTPQSEWPGSLDGLSMMMRPHLTLTRSRAHQLPHQPGAGGEINGVSPCRAWWELFCCSISCRSGSSPLIKLSWEFFSFQAHWLANE